MSEAKRMTLDKADEIEQHNRKWAARCLYGGMTGGLIAAIFLVQPSRWLGAFAEPVEAAVLLSSLIGGGYLGAWLFRRYWRQEYY